MQCKKSSLAEQVKTRLFREEVFDHQKSRWIGSILLKRSKVIYLFSYASVLLSFMLCAFVIFGEYTRHEAVQGEIQESQGVAKIYSPQVGIVIKQQVIEGQAVRRGDVLFVISAERNTEYGNSQENILNQIRTQQHALLFEQNKQDQISAELIKNLQIKLEKLEKVGTESRTAIAWQIKRLEITEKILARYRELASQHFYTDAALADKERDYLEAQATLAALRRQALENESDIESVRSDLRTTPFKIENLRSSYLRQISSLQQSASDTEMRREINVTATLDGTVTSILVQRGQIATTSQPLVSIVPSTSLPEAWLYAPSRSIGFVRKGAEVLVRYEPYPYQKFGQHPGRVIDISHAAIASNELPPSIHSDEPLYRIRVALNRPSVTAYGKEEKLQSGMRLEGNIRIDTRKIYEWILEPLYSIQNNT